MPTRRDLANAIRALSMDAVQKANSGHPGMPMGMADIAEVLWNDFLRHNPAHPHWANRDRFVLSNGHGCMLQYALLHLAGYAVTLDDLKQFRQLGSITPGHPERGDTPGVETTTGPLGQGFASAVGMAIAERHLAAQFNRGEHQIVDHHTYVFVGDGCLMEGISHEAASLAGTLKLGKLITFYDDNAISIDGDVSGWFTDNTPERFRAYNWHVIEAVDGHDPDAIRQAIHDAREVTDRPTLICCKTVIGFGAPNKQGSASTHGAPLGDTEVAAARETLGWPHAPFDVPQPIYDAWDARSKGAVWEKDWQAIFADYERAHPEQAAEFLRRMDGRLPDDFIAKSDAYITHTQSAQENIATRKASEHCLNAYGPMLPELVGGSADLTGSNNTWFSNSESLTGAHPHGNYLHYGVREFGMFALMNGMRLHGGILPYGGTFLVFSDYGRNAIRLSALMKQRVIYVFTHDSIGLGEDGPTHQPIEHASTLRATPGLTVWRPCDVTETAVAWQAALSADGPSCLLLTRQGVPAMPRNETQVNQVKRGGYILQENKPGEKIDVILLATGSEVQLATGAANTLAGEGYSVRVVAMPSMEVFEQQGAAYCESVLPSSVDVRIAIEAGVPDCWYKYVGRTGHVIGLTRFGISAPYKQIYDEMGITEKAICDAARARLPQPLATETINDH